MLRLAWKSLKVPALKCQSRCRSTICNKDLRGKLSISASGPLKAPAMKQEVELDWSTEALQQANRGSPPSFLLLLLLTLPPFLAVRSPTWPRLRRWSFSSLQWPVCLRPSERTVAETDSPLQTVRPPHCRTTGNTKSRRLIYLFSVVTAQNNHFAESAFQPQGIN